MMKPKREGEKMKRILIDDQKCMACDTCQIACCVAHSDSQTLYGAIAQPQPPTSRVHVEVGGQGRGFPLGCRQCQDPQCVKACVTKALTLNADGVTIYDKARCIGCLMCFMACPFGAIAEAGGTLGAYSVSKCDLCVSLGQDPACVEACPTHALSFEDPDSYSKNKRVKYLVEMSAAPESAV